MKKLFQSLLYSLIIAVLIPTNVFAYDVETQSLFNRNSYHYQPSCEEESSSGGVPLSGTHAERMFIYYSTDGGLSEEQAAGVVGNAMAESGETIDPLAANGSSYRGIFQWDTADRWPRLVQWAQSEGKEPDDFDTQLEYSLLEATERGNMVGMKEQPDIPHAAWFWGRFFEVAITGGGGTAPLTNVQGLDVRTSNAQQVFDQFAGGGGGGGDADTEPSADAGVGTVIALDPGHGGAVPVYTDYVTRLKDRETDNSPEREDVLDVANRVKTQLEEAGYTVVLLRTEPTQQISKRERVDAAIEASAAMAVSIHTAPGPQPINEVWYQQLGAYRENRGDPDSRFEFTNDATATLSEQYATIMAETRTEAEGHPVDTDSDRSTQTTSLSRADLPSVGNISLLQLWADAIPWVYNEIEQDGPGDSITDSTKQAYADGIAAGIIEAAPAAVTNSDSSCDDSSTGTEGLTATILEYAWPTYESGKIEKKPEYAEAVERAQAEGLYVGGILYPGVDCGGWVTRLMLDSGYEPAYNSNGRGGNVASGQTPWLQGNWESLGHVGNVDDLRQGDVAINSGRSHTFMYAGEIEGFGDDVASASLDERAPMAGEENPTASNIEWFRKR